MQRRRCAGHLVAGLCAAVWLLTALPASAGAPKDLLEKGQKLYSQHDEELIIRHFFDDRRGGVFVDVGSFHWRAMSTTYYLEERLGWSGLAIDALPPLRKGYEDHRPRTKFFNYIVTDRSGEVQTLHVAGSLSSVFEDHLEDFPDYAEYSSGEIRVPTITLDDLLASEGIEEIDFLSMDIEGSEPQALAAFDIERYRPELVCIEAGEDTRERILAFFSEHGYERIDEYLSYDPANWYFRPRSSFVPRSLALAAGALVGLGGVAWWNRRSAKGG